VTHRHRWTADHASVGGLKENPGVFGDNGGVLIVEACGCGAQRKMTTWDHRNNRRLPPQRRRWVVQP